MWIHREGRCAHNALQLDLWFEYHNFLPSILKLASPSAEMPGQKESDSLCTYISQF